jgi:hypothetical protein
VACSTGFRPGEAANIQPLNACFGAGVARPGCGRGWASMVRWTMASSIGSSDAERSQARTVKTRPFQRTGVLTRASKRNVSAVTLSRACSTAMS